MNAARFRRAGACALFGALALGLAAPVAMAQHASGKTATAANPLAGVGGMRKVTATATISAIDPATRHVVMTSPSGEKFTLKAPASMRNFDKLQVGQKVTATYVVDMAFVLSPPNGKLPPDTETTMAARAAKGDLPAGIVANHIVFTGAILGIDKTANTLKVVSPKGGQVHTIDVTTPAGRAALSKLKVGDKVTAYITEAMLLSAGPA